MAFNSFWPTYKEAKRRRRRRGMGFGPKSSGRLSSRSTRFVLSSPSYFVLITYDLLRI